MRKILLLSSLLVMFLFLVACASQEPLTDEELEAELAKLAPEQRVELLKDLEAKEKGALAGQAISMKYTQVSPKMVEVSRTRIQAAVEKFLPECTDTDGSNEFVKGTVEGRWLTNHTNPPFPDGVKAAPGSNFVVGPEVVSSDSCGLHLVVTGESQGQKFDMDAYAKLESCSNLNLKPGDNSPYEGESLTDNGWKLKSIKECYVNEQSCSIFSYVSVDGVNHKQYPLVRENHITCPNGCKDGACLYEQVGPQPEPKLK